MGVVLVATGVAAVVPGAPPAAAATPRVLMVGDSTMRGMSATAQNTIRAAYDLTFDSGSCRRLITASCKPIPNALDVIRSNPGRDAVVIMTGYNDWTIGAAVDAIMAEAANQGVQSVVWLTYRTDIAEGAQKPIAFSAVFRDHNRELAEKAALHPTLRVLDWDAYSAGRDDWFAWDGFHLANPGGFALASLLRTTLDGLRLARCHADAATGTPVAAPVDQPATAASPASLGLATATRLLDTRAGGPLGAGRAVTVPVVAAGLAPADATSVLVNLGAVEPCGGGFLAAYPCGPVPNASNANFSMRVTVANLAAVRLDAQGAFCVYTSRQTDLIVDLLGVFQGAGQRFNPVAPERMVDTRSPGAARLPLTGRLAAGVPLRMPLRGQGSVPAGAQAVALNLTVVGPAAPGFATAFPCGPVPATSNLNFPTARAVANLVVVPLAGDGSVCVQSSVATHVLADVVGWFGASGKRFQASSPQRLVDTRSGRGAPLGPVAGGTSLAFDLPVPSLLNVTAVGPTRPGFLTTYPCGAVPVVSTLNYLPGQAVPNLTAVGVSGAKACVFSDQSAHVLVDTLGRFVD